MNTRSLAIATSTSAQERDHARLNPAPLAMAPPAAAAPPARRPFGAAPRRLEPLPTRPLGRRRAPCRLITTAASAGGGGSASDDESFATKGGEVGEVDAAEAEVDAWGELSTGNLHFLDSGPGSGGGAGAPPGAAAAPALGLARPADVVGAPWAQVQDKVAALLERLPGAPPGAAASTYPAGAPQVRVSLALKPQKSF